MDNDANWDADLKGSQPDESPRSDTPAQSEVPEMPRLDRATAARLFDDSMIVTEAVAPRVRERFAASAQRSSASAKAARRAFRNFDLSRHSPKVREQATFLTPGSDLATVLEEVVRDDIRAMVDSDKKQGLSVTLTADEMATLGLTPGLN